MNASTDVTTSLKLHNIGQSSVAAREMHSSFFPSALQLEGSLCVRADLHYSPH